MGLSASGLIHGILKTLAKRVGLYSSLPSFIRYIKYLLNVIINTFTLLSENNTFLNGDVKLGSHERKFFVRAYESIVLNQSFVRDFEREEENRTLHNGNKFLIGVPLL